MGTQYTGKDLYVKFGSTDLNTDFRTLKLADKCDLAEATAGSDTRQSFIAKPTTGDITLNMLDSTGSTALFTTLAVGSSGTLEWGPEGTGTGKPKYTATVIVTAFDTEYPYNDVCKMDATFKLNSAISGTVY